MVHCSAIAVVVAFAVVTERPAVVSTATTRIPRVPPPFLRRNSDMVSIASSFQRHQPPLSPPCVATAAARPQLSPPRLPENGNPIVAWHRSFGKRAQTWSGRDARCTPFSFCGSGNRPHCTCDDRSGDTDRVRERDRTLRRGRPQGTSTIVCLRLVVLVDVLLAPQHVSNFLL